MAAVRYSSFRELMELLAPGWLRQPQGLAWMRAFGDVKDSQVGRTKDAVKARFPTHAPRDALEFIGDERGLPRAPADTNTTFGARLRAAWEKWPKAGTALGILTALRDLGYTNTYLVSRLGHVHSLDGSGNLVTGTTGFGAWSYGANHWNHFDVVFPTPFITQWVAPGSIPEQSSAEGRLILRTVKRWRPAMAGLDRIIFQGTGNQWGYPFTLTWGAGTWGSGTAPTIWEVND
jgi:hypothetical protein